MSRLVLHKIERTSPSLWTHMRLCGLRAALVATPQAGEWVLHDPRRWLGSAFHAVMQTLRSGGTQSPEEIWDAEIASAIRTALAHPLDRRFSSPPRWPSYFLVRQRSLSLASQTPRRKPQAVAQVGTFPPSTRYGAERRYEARKGQLVGKPDYYDGDTLTEYTSSLPDPLWAGAVDIIDGFKRQLRIYAAIIAEANGRWPTGARIIAASGQKLEIAISPSDCDHEADEAVAALNKLNQHLTSAYDPDTIASPSPSHCASCDYKIICPVFWKALSNGDLQDIKTAAIEGILTALQDGQDGDLYTAELKAISSSRTTNANQQIVLRKSIHGELRHASIGETIRLIDFVVRADGRVRAEVETIVAATANIPAISTDT